VQLLAHHYSAAALLGHAATAVHYLVEAARVADRGLAHAEAARLLERAADLCADQYEREAHVLSAARSYRLACEFERALALLHSVATEGHRRHRLPSAIAYEDAAWFISPSGHRALGLLNSALEGVTADPEDKVYVRAIAGLGRATACTGAHEQGEVLAGQAIDMARVSGDPELLCGTLAASMQVGFRPAVNSTKLARALELSTMATHHGLWLHLGPAAYHRAFIAYQSGDAPALAAARAHLSRTAEAAGHRYWSYVGGLVDFAVALMTGRFDEAERASRSALELGESFGADDAEGPYGVQSFMLRRETGGLEAVRSLVSGDEAIHDYWPPALLALYTELGLPGAAARVMRSMLTQKIDTSSARQSGVVAFLAEAVLALGDVDAALRVRPMLEEYAGLNMVMGPFVAVFGAADRYRAGLDALLNQGAPNETFAAALDLDTRTGATLHQAHTLAAWASHARRSGDVKHAVELGRRARAIAEPQRMVRVLSVLDREMRAVGPNAGAYDGRLTVREEEVLELLAEGCSNRDIARRLRISENTAANHVRSILIKTDSSNRTQAAIQAKRSDRS
jgi:DNA-binding NarL/FixJ family response regulator